MEAKKQRDSGVELMRILCMLLIIAHHYSMHGGFETAAIAASGARGVFVQMLRMFGRPACSAFALASGYYMAVQGKERRLRGIVPLLAEQFFYSAALLGVICLTHLRPVSVFDAVHAMVPVVWGNWYVVGYVVLYFLIPFINPWLQAMEKKTYQRLLAVLLFFWSLIPTFAINSMSYSSLDFFLVMYLVGGYIRLHVRSESYPNWLNLVAIFISAGLMLFSVLAINTLGHWLHSETVIDLATWFYNYDTLLSVVFAVSLFLYFSRLHFSNRLISYLAGSMIGVYLLHDNDLIRGWLWTELSPNAAHIGSVWVHAPVKILTVFAVCLAIDLLRRATIGKLFERWFYSRCDAICAWMLDKMPKPLRVFLSDSDQVGM